MATSKDEGSLDLPKLRIEVDNEFEAEMETDAFPDATDSDARVDEDVEDGEVSDKDRDSPRLRPSSSPATSAVRDLVGDKTGLTITSQLNKEKRYANKAGSVFVTGVDVFGEEEHAKLTERAKRFALDHTKMKPLTELELSKLYASVGVRPDEDSCRLESLHMRGTEDMSTEDIFTYFKAYGPASIEWINDFSCNVLWLDEVSAARALIGLSRPVKGLDKLSYKSDTEDTTMKDETSDQVSDPEEVTAVDAAVISIPVPPGKWRLGVEHPKAKNILLRFSTRSDKKPRQAEKNSDYYKRHGNPNYGGIKGLLTESRKRRFRRDESQVTDPWGEIAQTWSNPEEPVTEPREQSRTRLPRMRMYADDEEVKIEKRKAHQADLRSRLQRERRNSPESDNDSDDTPIQRKRFAGDLRSKLNSKQQQLVIELDHEQYYELIASESDH